jgi:hypothetical protein
LQDFLGRAFSVFENAAANISNSTFTLNRCHDDTCRELKLSACMGVSWLRATKKGRWSQQQ